MKKILISILFILSVSIGVFSLTSKNDYDPSSQPVACQNLQSTSGYIQINFAQPPFFGFRKLGFENYIPSPDLRFQNFPPGTSQFMDDKYFCFVTVSSPNCSDWHWQGALSAINCSPSGKMLIGLPPNQYDATIKVEYWEIGDRGIGNTLVFNYPPSYYGTSFAKSRIKYQFQQTYMGGAINSINVPIIVTLFPIENNGYEASGNQITNGG